VESSRYRILCIGETWLGSDARAVFSAFRRLGNSVQVLDESNYVSIYWKTTISRILRKIFKPFFVRELRLDALRLISSFKPHCVFVFKGSWVHPAIIASCRDQNIRTVNYYPDVSFLSHGQYLPRTLPLYDHIFTAKSYGVEDMRTQLGVSRISFLPPGYDPELHRPLELSEEERQTYGCDVVFIGMWSPKKERLLASLKNAMPKLALRIWGPGWGQARSSSLAQSIMGRVIIGDEYTKAIRGAAICLGLLSEGGKGSSSGDLITARTFQIPACRTFMLHERNTEVLDFFEEGVDAAFFDGSVELAEKIDYYLKNAEQREVIARNGLARSLQGEYAVDGRARTILKWLDSQLNGHAVD
jgi:spore maturation protein CgeB